MKTQKLQSSYTVVGRKLNIFATNTLIYTNEILVIISAFVAKKSD